MLRFACELGWLSWALYLTFFGLVHPYKMNSFAMGDIHGLSLLEFLMEK